MFAFYLESYANEYESNARGHDDIYSFVDFGEVVLGHMREGSQPVWFHLTSHMYWMVENINAVRFITDRADQKGEEELADIYGWLRGGPSSYPGIFDSGTSMMMVPSPIYSKFINRLFHHAARDVDQYRH